MKKENSKAIKTLYEKLFSKDTSKSELIAAIIAAQMQILSNQSDLYDKLNKIEEILNKEFYVPDITKTGPR